MTCRPIDGEQEWFARYWGAYIQDDWRMSPKLSLNSACGSNTKTVSREIENRQTVAFDRTVVNPIDAMVNKTGTLLQGRTIMGGLVYAGVNGAPEDQGDPQAIKVSPRVGVTLRSTIRR